MAIDFFLSLSLLPILIILKLFIVSFDIVVFYTFTFFMNVYICIRILSLIV